MDNFYLVIDKISKQNRIEYFFFKNIKIIIKDDYILDYKISWVINLSYF